MERQAGKKLDVFNGLVIWKRYNLTHITYTVGCLKLGLASVVNLCLSPSF